jgi:type II secretory pathway pseudopilin PulG
MMEANMDRGELVRRRGQRGFTYVAMLFALAIFGVGLASLGESWAMVSHRDKEDELIKIVSEYINSINSYYIRSPGTPKTFPLHLEDLMEDRRFAGTVRHLRKVYRDPMTGQAEWGLIRNPAGGIVGVYSLSEKDTLRRQGPSLEGALPVSGKRYMEWKFSTSLAVDFAPASQSGAASPHAPSSSARPPTK